MSLLITCNMPMSMLCYFVCTYKITKNNIFLAGREHRFGRTGTVC